MKKILYRWLLPKLLKKACESRIARSGVKGEQVNCYVVVFDREKSPFFIAKKYYNGKLFGLKWDGKSYSNSIEISLEDLDKGEFIVTHYYGLSEVTYKNVYDLAFNYITKWVYIKFRLYQRIDSINQYFFNKRKLITKRRIELLRFMMADQIDRTHKGINSLDLMTKLYSIRWVSHPSGNDQQELLELYLDSLVKSGDLDKTNEQFVVTGKTISTLEKYEEEERRHTEAVKLQRKMFWLTILLFLIAIVQSGIIKLPTLLDFS